MQGNWKTGYEKSNEVTELKLPMQGFLFLAPTKSVYVTELY